MILVKKMKFFHRLCLSKMDREKVFADVLDKKKKAFKDYKNNCVRKTEKRIFSKGLVPRFDQKFEITPTLIFLQK